MSRRKPAARQSGRRGPDSSVQSPSMAGVILCGGSGTRMGRTRAHKVCVPLAGRPAVVRLLDTLRSEGVDPIVVVVGHRCGDVVETIGSVDSHVHFVFQRDRLGTGHAARLGIEALSRFGYDGSVLITMGDKWLAPGMVAAARERFVKARADLLLVTTTKRAESTAGRLVKLPGRGISRIVELRDIERSRVLADWLAMAEGRKTLSKAALRRAGLKRINPARKLWRAVGPLARFSRGTGTVRSFDLTQAIREAGVDISVADRRLGPDEVEQRSSTVNESVYIGKLDVLREALLRVGRANAQDEYYLTDVVEIIGSGLAGPSVDGRGRITEYKRPRAEVMAFNTSRELRMIEEHVAAQERRPAARVLDKQTARCLLTPEQWFNLLDPGSPRGRRMIERTYGWGGPLIPGRLGAMRKVVRLFVRTYGSDRKVLLVRAPGRINLMGRHIDHQGGYVHSLALDCEIIMAAAPRQDDVFRLVNADKVSFPPRELVLGDWHAALRAVDWLGFVDGDAVRTHLLSTAGDWSNYILAAALFQQFQHPERRLCGMDAAVSGNVPMAAGLSSSSSVVVAAMEAISALNGISMSGSDVVSACGQGEWFVGSRGGAADHAAIRLGRAGQAARMGFHPFRLDSYVPIPSSAALLIAYSGEHAVKSAGARDRFNERVACYRLGILLLREMYPRLANKLEHIRDVSPSGLALEPERVREMIDALPNGITRRQLVLRLGKRGKEELNRVFASHVDPGRYTVRDVVAYGVGECERSRICAELLSRGDLEGFGELMLLSHDGDRVCGRQWAPKGPRREEDSDGSAGLCGLVGRYACSTKNLDRLVDLVRDEPGVYGAQLAGAGLGGCVMILTKRSAVTRVRALLARKYYDPLGMTPAVWLVRSVAGGGVIRP